MGEPLNELATKRLFLRLDEANTGSISLSTFQAFVRQGNVRDTVNLYASGKKRLLAKAPLVNSGFLVSSHADPHLPLLVWIDDDEYSIPRVVEAAKQGITVFQFISTSTVKSWVMINLGELKFLRVQVQLG